MEPDFEVRPSVLAPGPRRHHDPLARLLFWPLLLLLMGATVFFNVLYAPLRVVGDSMEPNLHHGDRLLRTTKYSDATRGDIVIIDAGTSSDQDDIVKRVVAVAGDTIEIRDDIALINGKVEQTSDILRVEEQGLYRDPVIVPPGTVYVLGDNRPVSLDSRMLGPIPLGKIRGRARYVFLPLYDMRRL